VCYQRLWMLELAWQQQFLSAPPQRRQVHLENLELLSLVMQIIIYLLYSNLKILLQIVSAWTVVHLAQIR
jgi:hypothetical protein